MNFKHLKTFITVARCGNFSVAAAKLHTVQSAVSRHITTLERELDVCLFERNTRNVKLTAAGEAFFNHAKAIISHCETAKTDTQLIAAGKKGVLRIGYVSSACAHFLPQLLRHFRQDEPNIDIKIYELTAAEQLNAFSDNMLDIGFSRPVVGGYDGRVERKHLCDDPIYAVVAQEHPLAQHAHLALDDIASFPLALFARAHAPSLFDTLTNAFYKQNIEPDLHDEPISMQALLTHVASGNSVALVPGCVRNLQTTHCTFIPLATPLYVSLEMHWLKQPSSTADTWLQWCDNQTEQLSTLMNAAGFSAHR
ncbi:LysR substrate-binding domain-containing protein [Alteromonas sp. C1M14]|uniref:LysR substrate-binding domain-containing protein n=1 Tax=Alteromonas sp. C1M14 TaxID=2841567 RepID=UPI001C0A6190|nr:LysR family transcriptional regulator [Alteromonas sp. C1M14]